MLGNLPQESGKHLTTTFAQEIQFLFRHVVLV